MNQLHDAPSSNKRFERAAAQLQSYSASCRDLRIADAGTIHPMWGHGGGGRVELLRNDGWFEVARRGSHRQLRHPARKGRVTVPGKPSDNLAPSKLPLNQALQTDKGELSCLLHTQTVRPARLCR
jgi:predicted RNA binding protein YcfA (HicA-like mRNA interferase family)